MAGGSRGATEEVWRALWVEGTAQRQWGPGRCCHLPPGPAASPRLGFRRMQPPLPHAPGYAACALCTPWRRRARTHMCTSPGLAGLGSAAQRDLLTDLRVLHLEDAVVGLVLGAQVRAHRVHQLVLGAPGGHDDAGRGTSWGLGGFGCRGGVGWGTHFCWGGGLAMGVGPHGRQAACGGWGGQRWRFSVCLVGWLGSRSDVLLRLDTTRRLVRMDSAAACVYDCPDTPCSAQHRPSAAPWHRPLPPAAAQGHRRSGRARLPRRATAGSRWQGEGHHP